ncbi:hypothetical protein [Lacunimicrobium album]
MLLSPSSRSLATLIFSLALLSAMTQATFAGEEKPSKKIELPKKVETAFKKLALKGEIESDKKEIEDEKAVYEVEVEVKGGTVELSYTENGELVCMEIELGSHEEDEDDEEEKEEGHAKKVKHEKSESKKDKEDDKNMKSMTTKKSTRAKKNRILKPLPLRK